MESNAAYGKFLFRDFLRTIRIKKLEFIGFYRFFCHMVFPLSKYSLTVTDDKPAFRDIPRQRCIGCGLCYSVCKFNAITMVQDDTGFAPQLIESTCVDCGMCSKVCPGINVLSYPGLLGDVRKIVVSHAKNPNIRHAASYDFCISKISTKLALFVSKAQTDAFCALFTTIFTMAIKASFFA